MPSFEKNARQLIAMMVERFPVGGTSEDLRKQFEMDAHLVNQSFYNALKYAKQQGWLAGGGRGQPYTLSLDGAWKEPDIASIGASIGVSRDKDQLEHLVGTQTQQIQGLQSEIARLRDWSNGNNVDGAGVAIPSLVRVITDGASTMRQKLKGAETILNYRVEDASVVEFTKKFLQSVCTGADVATDHRVEAAGLLRRCESPRIAPETVRPNYREDESNAEPVEPLSVVIARRRAHCDPLTRQLEIDNGWQGPSTVTLPGDVTSTQHTCNMQIKDELDQ